MFKVIKFFASYRNISVTQHASFHMTPPRNRAKVIDGKEVAKNVLSEMKAEIKEFMGRGNRAPHLTAVLVGNNPASESYVRIKLKAAAKVGITADTIRCDETIDGDSLLEQIQELNTNPNIDGVLVQLPLPPHLNERDICNAVAPEKDVDGFNISNVGRLCLNMDAMVPCTALAVHQIIHHTGISTIGKTAVVCGRSKNVGMPIALLLHSQGGESGGGLDATTTICHRYTPQKELSNLTKSADIIVSCTGVPKLIRGDMVKEGACVIDVGMTRLVNKETKKATFVGDVDFNEVVEVAGHITPVPGGVGPVTVAMVLRNTFRAAQLQLEYSSSHRMFSI